MKSKARHKGALLPRFRVMSGQDIALGPGKVELLTHVKKTGSIGEAAKRMDMSYMRAWSLIQMMNACFKEPLVKSARGGHERGGAALTKTGREALEFYRRLERISLKESKDDWLALQKLLRD